MDPTKIRMRFLLSCYPAILLSCYPASHFFLAAVVTAAALRHLLHVQVGFTREEIRTGGLITAAIGIFLAVAFFRWRRRP
jgi:hypothetical protein